MAARERHIDIIEPRVYSYFMRTYAIARDSINQSSIDLHQR
jgi:hypothetical protein